MLIFSDCFCFKFVFCVVTRKLTLLHLRLKDMCYKTVFAKEYRKYLMLGNDMIAAIFKSKGKEQSECNIPSCCYAHVFFKWVRYNNICFKTVNMFNLLIVVHLICLFLRSLTAQFSKIKSVIRATCFSLNQFKYR